MLRTKVTAVDRPAEHSLDICSAFVRSDYLVAANAVNKFHLMIIVVKTPARIHVK
jgi:hypothetical protein